MSPAAKTYPPAAFWADERVPDLSEMLRPHGIDAAAFSAWLGPLLARHRGLEEVRDVLEVPPAEQVMALRRLRTALQELAPLLRPHAIPPRTDAVAFHEAFKRGLSLDELRRRLAIDAQTYAAVLGSVERAISAAPGKRGRKPKRTRDELLADVVQRLRDLGCTADSARECAEQILVACRVEVPENERAIRRAVSKGTGPK